jgi:hypothetical protein
VHPIKSPSLFSQSKNLTASTLLNNIKQNQIDKSRCGENPAYNNNPMLSGMFNENDIFKNNFLFSQINGFKTNQYINYNNQAYQKNVRNNYIHGSNLFTKNKPKTIKSDQNLAMLRQYETKNDIEKHIISEPINSIVLNIQVKTGNGLKSVVIRNRDNIYLIVDKFCKENKLDSNLASPIHHYIKKAISSIDEVLYKNINDIEFNKIKNIHEKYTESKKCDDINLSCMTAGYDDIDQDVEDNLNKTL